MIIQATLIPGKGMPVPFGQEAGQDMDAKGNFPIPV
jgi:hypothetical protein